jgi:preprotein translocase subunit SecA
MLGTLLAKVIGTQNDRELKRLRPLVEQVNALEPSVKALTDEQLRAKTPEFRERLAKGETLNDLMPEAFAVVREAGRRVLNMRHFDVQIIGGSVLHIGAIAEMKTGEGKTLVATLPAYLNALEGKGVHVVTTNDYLARRDSEWMGKIHRFLGMTVGVIQHELNDAERQQAYSSDITYGTNNEFGFDYLRDNMKFELSQYVQRGHHFAIVDEVDSILIDEARTPLIISGPAEASTELYYEVDRIIPRLKPGAKTKGDVKAEEREALDLTGDYIVDEKHKTVTLTESGMQAAEKHLANRLNGGHLYDMENAHVKHHVEQALRAHAIFKVDVDYMIKDGQVVIVDEFTGRLMPGRRWSDGLHQAVEAKEKVKIERENQTLATITFQNYFRKYKKLSGMTGTAETEAEEFAKIYKLDVIVIPPNRTLRRVEEPDSIYRTGTEKNEAIVNDILTKQEAGRPVLVGTVSIEKSEKLSSQLKRRGIKHVVLNAKYHAQEAEFVAQAGRKGTVTIATNMAGRGTDILLGGNPEYMTRQQLLGEQKAERLPKGEERFTDDDAFVYYYHIDGFYKAARADWDRIFGHFKRQTDAEHEEVVGLGGLHIVGTERHEARRIDNQLRGRAGRQGDPGSSRFYLSLEDDLMRIFGSDRIAGLMQRLGMEDGVPIEHGMVTRAIERAQKQVEAQNFGTRKHLLEYDDVMNKQRENIYALRRELLEGKIRVEDEEAEEVNEIDTRAYLMMLGEDVVDDAIEAYAGKDTDPEEWDLDSLRIDMSRVFGLDAGDYVGLDLSGKTAEEIREALWERIVKKYDAKEQMLGAEGATAMRQVERFVMLETVDRQWKDHLYSLDHLKEGIGLRGYGQKDPLVEYKKESFDLFQDMKRRVDEDMVNRLWTGHFVFREDAPPRPPQRRVSVPMTLNEPSAEPVGAFASAPRAAAPAPLGLPTRPATPARVGGDDAPVQTVRRDEPKVGRNDPCPCGSGKKYKKCHGAAT